MKPTLRTAIGSLLLVAVAVWPRSINAADGRFTITGLTGAESTGEIVAIEPGGKVRLKGRSEPVLLSGLRKLKRAGNAGRTPATADVVVRLEYGGTINAAGVTIKDEKVTVKPANGKPVTLPLEVVRAIRYGGKPSPLFVRALQTTSADYDRFLIVVEGKTRTVRGLLESLDAKSASVVVNNRNITVGRNDLKGIVFASTKPKKITAGMTRVHLIDGSQVVAEVKSLSKQGELQLKFSQGAKLTLPWANVVALDVYSDRLQYLSDLTPTAVTERAIVTLKRKWQKDRNVTGGPLAVGGKTYEKGIGVHAESRMTFAVDGKYETFSAVAGLDDRDGQKGDCVFVVLADGRELFRQRATGKGKPIAVNVKLNGAQRLTLVVEAGKNLDIGDHANWCAACLIRPAGR